MLAQPDGDHHQYACSDAHPQSAADMGTTERAARMGSIRYKPTMRKIQAAMAYQT